MNERIRREYVTPGNPTAFSAPGAVARRRGVSYARAREALEHLPVYVSHREYKRPAAFNPYFVYRRRELVQADLIEIGELSRSNGGVKYLLLVIDVFTKKIWVYPLKAKNAASVEDALRTWLERDVGAAPKLFSTDHGLEFNNGRVRALLESRDVRQLFADGTCKAAVAERANKSLQILIYKYLSDRQTKRYIDHLPLLVRSYNSRRHRTLEGMTPNEADLRRNEARVRGIHEARYARVKRKRPSFRAGQVVKVKIQAKAMSHYARAYNPQFSDEYYVIADVNTEMPVPMYRLKAMDDDENIKGHFYANELTAARGDVFKIERVLDERGEGPDRELLIKWLFFGPRWNTWVRAADVRFTDRARNRGFARRAAAAVP
ncbi:MAG: DDE-type integrase/transposase/recombinase [Symploca sp. SIO1A3]|nr:DDE-type integrase/transposase/recombinase [Symploca sp. SIO1A3]